MSKHFAGSSSQYLFSQVPQANIPRCRLMRSVSHKTTFNAGQLIPFYCDEVIPGDTHTLSLAAFSRLTTQVVPVMDNLYMDFQFFFVPYRLVWEHWEAMHGDKPNPTDSIDYSVPFIPGVAGGVKEGSLADYLGLPLNVRWGDHDVNALFFRAYNLIWNEWYRDENLQTRAPQHFGDDGDTLDDYVVLPRNKRKDYFTSCLPWPQKGESVLLPLGISSPVEIHGNGLGLGLRDGSIGFTMKYYDSGYGKRFQPGSPIGAGVGSIGSDVTLTDNVIVGVTGNYAVSGLEGRTILDRDVSPTVNDLREAFQVQRLLERDARGGTRYRELLKAHYGVVSPDSRLQVPELLGTCSCVVSIDEVAQNSATQAGTTAQGNLTGIGVFNAGKDKVFQKSFTEWGCIIGLVSVRSDLSYQQGIPRVFSKATRFDYYYPALAHLGEQAVLNKEIYAQDYTVLDADSNVVNNMAFGYQERWAEYKYHVNKITGEMRSTAALSLDAWHLAQDFGALPTLSGDFIKENPPLARLLAVSDTPAILFDSRCVVESVRPMPLYDVPGLIDHF